MFCSSEEEINDDVSSEDDKNKDLDSAERRKKTLIPLAKVELAGSDKNRIATQCGIIALSFPQTTGQTLDRQEIPFPITYTTTTSKERLLLLFAENFRRQYNVAFEHRRPLILAVANETGIQKFVSTTIRSTALLFPDMIGNWEGPAQFVADFIAFETLPDPVLMPNRLVSPDTLLRRRKGNSFEMATLLCSLLIGNGFRAMVVSGYATREVVNNNQERVVCPFVPRVADEDVDSDDLDAGVKVAKENKYALQDPIDLRSKFELEMAERRAKERAQDERNKLEEEQRERERLERLDDDPYHGWRVHAWVAIIPKEKSAKRSICSSTATEESVFFVEPCTGFRVETSDPAYLAIESVWNEHNYHVNCQEPITNIASMKWNFSDASQWQTLLVDEMTAVRAEIADASDALNRKYLDMPHSWVNKLHVNNTAYEEKFPGGHKTIRYKRAIYERFQNYYNTDGLMKRLTIYENLNYVGQLRQWQWYENRADLLFLIKIDFVQQQTNQYFDKGRPDKLRRCTYTDDPTLPTVFYFNWRTRIDALKRLEKHPKYIREYFGQRDDKLISREFTVEDEERLICVSEKFERDPKKESRHNISIRTFDLTNGFIRLQYHYGKDEITPTIREFKRPPEPEYGCEIVYNFEDSETNKFNKEEHLSKVEQYLLLLEQLRAEEHCMKAYKLRSDDISQIAQNRSDEMANPTLSFSIFDSLRNSAARSMRLARQEQLERRKELVLKSQPDYLAPYLVRYSHRKPTNTESETIMNACLRDFEAEYVYVLNELQRAYEDQAAEEESLRQFLNKFQHQFEDFEYEVLAKQGERIESNKRVLQQRIETVQREFQEKYETIRISIINDKRLEFNDLDVNGATEIQ